MKKLSTILSNVFCHIAKFNLQLFVTIKCIYWNYIDITIKIFNMKYLTNSIIFLVFVPFGLSNLIKNDKDS